MRDVVGRHFLKEKEKKILLQSFSETFGIEAQRLFGPKPRIEVFETLKHKIFIINGVPCLAKSDANLFPTLMFKEMLALIPKVTVDMGAVPYICNGADIMAPGIVKINGGFKEKTLIVVLDQKYEKPIAIGRALFDSESSKALRQGKIFENLHYVGDSVWNTIKKFPRNEKVKT